MFPGVLCFDNDVHIFGGYKIVVGTGGPTHIPTGEAFAYRWKVIDGTTFTGWKKLTPLPLALAFPTVFQSGQAHCAFGGGCGKPLAGDPFGSVPMIPDNRNLFIYHSVTDTWVALGALPEPAARRDKRFQRGEAPAGHPIFGGQAAGV